METMRTVEEIARDHGCTVESGIELSTLTSVGVGGPADWLVMPRSIEAVPALVADLAKAGERIRFLGKGTNLLVDDRGVHGVVIRLSRLEERPRIEGNRLRAHAGASLPHLTQLAVRAGLRGLEFAEGIPGSLGGALVMNAGAFGGELGPRVRWARCVRSDGTFREGEVSPDLFGYRRSPFGSELVLEMELELEPDDPEKLREEVREFRQRRIASQPLGRRSMGCVFRNPEGESAGRLIDQAGLKGRRRGGAAVSRRHANYLVNLGGATSGDFLALIDDVQEKVWKATKISLEEEIRVWWD